MEQECIDLKSIESGGMDEVQKIINEILYTPTGEYTREDAVRILKRIGIINDDGSVSEYYTDIIREIDYLCTQ